MQLRVFGRTGMQLSVLGFGCGAVGGFMVRGDPADQERTIARAIAAGVNYFDTAVQYGNGESEKNLGRVLQKLKPAKVAVASFALLQHVGCVMIVAGYLITCMERGVAFHRQLVASSVGVHGRLP
jgi:predicted aldo/keto reductase-like oxidoreductase